VTTFRDIGVDSAGCEVLKSGDYEEFWHLGCKAV
jgi:hypothetical protein